MMSNCPSYSPSVISGRSLVTTANVTGIVDSNVPKKLLIPKAFPGMLMVSPI